jgi:serine-type D-Ala-D-Ala carboxypeptidase/endopeptidase
LGSLGLHLLDESIPLGKPRTVKTPTAEFQQAVVGRYNLIPGLDISITIEDGKLYSQSPNQAKYELAYDSAGDLYPLEYDAIIRPKKLSNGSYQLTFFQSGGVFPMKRIEQNTASANVAIKTDLNDYIGQYPLAPGFVLTVSAESGVLKAQATGQGAFPLVHADQDIFTASEHGIEIRFQRNKQGKVDSLNLLQGGQNTPARKQ